MIVKLTEPKGIVTTKNIMYKIWRYPIDITIIGFWELWFIVENNFWNSFGIMHIYKTPNLVSYSVSLEN